MLLLDTHRLRRFIHTASAVRIAAPGGASSTFSDNRIHLLARKKPQRVDRLLHPRMVGHLPKASACPQAPPDLYRRPTCPSPRGLRRHIRLLRSPRGSGAITIPGHFPSKQSTDTPAFASAQNQNVIDARAAQLNNTVFQNLTFCPPMFCAVGRAIVKLESDTEGLLSINCWRRDRPQISDFPLPSLGRIAVDPAGCESNWHYPSIAY